jgi:hypothetical protein
LALDESVVLPVGRADQPAEERALEIELKNGITITCFPCTQRSLRGWSIPVGVLDELAFYRLEGSAVSDSEIQTSVRRGMLAFAETRLVKISTPYMRGGVLFDDFRNYYGTDSLDVLVWKAPSVLMNPSLRAERMERERRLDPQRFRREYEAEFIDDLAALFDALALEACVVPGRRELPPADGVEYVAVVAVVLADRTPLPLAQIGSPFLPGDLRLACLVQPLLLGDIDNLSGHLSPPHSVSMFR